MRSSQCRVGHTFRQLTHSGSARSLFFPRLSTTNRLLIGDARSAACVLIVGGQGPHHHLCQSRHSSSHLAAATRACSRRVATRPMGSAAPPNTGEHQPVPQLSAGLPFTLQLGSTGAGIGLGCGVGVGFLTPINLGTIPVLGQAAQGISAGLGGVLGGAGQSARQAVRSLGVQGLDAGAGCGILVGYFFGAGLMLKPSAVEQVVIATSALVGQVTQRLQQAGHRGHPAAPPGASAALSPGHGAGQVEQLRALQPQQQQQQPSTAGQARVRSRHPQPESALLMRTLLQQQGELQSLRRETRALRAAVCKLDPRAAVCSRPRGSGGRSGSSDGA